MSHVAYLSDLDNGKCPSTHPVPLLKLFYEVSKPCFDPCPLSLHLLRLLGTSTHLFQGGILDRMLGLLFTVLIPLLVFFYSIFIKILQRLGKWIVSNFVPLPLNGTSLVIRLDSHGMEIFRMAGIPRMTSTHSHDHLILLELILTGPSRMPSITVITQMTPQVQAIQKHAVTSQYSARPSQTSARSLPWSTRLLTGQLRDFLGTLVSNQIRPSVFLMAPIWRCNPLQTGPEDATLYSDTDCPEW